jgi:hypothetical protein
VELLRNTYKVLVGRYAGKVFLQGRWKEILRMRIEWEGVKWNRMDQKCDQWQAVVKMVMDIWIPQKGRKIYE